MNTLTDIGICGGGNLSHAMAAALARKGYRVHVLTRRPEEWSHELFVSFCGSEYRRASLAEVSRHPDCLRDCRFIIAALPRFAVAPVSTSIRPFLTEDQLLLFAPGTPQLLEMQTDEKWRGLRYGAFYKVPYICRTDEYGHRVSILGSRPLNRIWLSGAVSQSEWQELESLFDTPLEELTSAWPFLLTNSNPLLHPSRLRVLFKDYHQGVIYHRVPLFYEEWTDESSELYLRADDELLRLCEHCPEMRIGKDIIPIREYYESSDAAALTRKIRSIAAFKGIVTPMTRQGNAWIPDFNSRYFQEDIRWGTLPICEYGRKVGIATPVLDDFVTWALHLLPSKG